MKKAWGYIENFFVTLYRGTKSSWKKYHLLIPPKLWWKYIKLLLGIRPVKKEYYNPAIKEQYNLWLKNNPQNSGKMVRLKYQPLVSFLVPVYNVESKYLRECLDSILGQIYKNIEVCVVDDASTKEETKKVLREYEKKKKVKVKYRTKNGHISRATNDALKMAKGEFVALMDNDDTIPENAIYEVVKVLNQNRKIDMVYTDEDKIDTDGEFCEPSFKSDFAPESFYSSNYLSHLGVLRKSIVEKIGGFRPGYEGAQDYDLYLRFLEQADRIYHLPMILYHWRKIEGSTSMEIDNKDYALVRGKRALEDALERRGIKGTVTIAEDVPLYKIRYKIIGNPKVSIIIPTKDMAKLLKKCLRSIYKRTTYQNFEVVVVNNNSTEKKTFRLFEKYKGKHDNFRVIDAPIKFNYSKLNNIAARQTKSDYILLLNNDTEVITPDWLEWMIGYAEQEHVGTVGVKLLYRDRTIQHGGVVLGLGVGSHAFMGLGEYALVWGGRLSVPYNYSAVTAACLMVSRKKWEEVGGLEEDLQVAYNDVDFNLKLLEEGYYNVFVPMVELFHYESKSRGADDSPEKKKRFDSEQLYMYQKWTERIRNDEFYNINYSRRTGFMLEKGKHGNGDQVDAWLKKGEKSGK